MHWIHLSHDRKLWLVGWFDYGDKLLGSKKQGRFSVYLSAMLASQKKTVLHEVCHVSLMICWMTASKPNSPTDRFDPLQNGVDGFQSTITAFWLAPPGAWIKYLNHLQLWIIEVPWSMPQVVCSQQDSEGRELSSPLRPWSEHTSEQILAEMTHYLRHNFKKITLNCNTTLMTSRELIRLL